MTNETLGAASAGPALLRAIGPRLLLFVVIGDMLGTGIYALTGDVAGQVGGAAWLAFGGAFIVAMFTATSYLELVGKYPRAAGAALYVQKAFDCRLITFLVAFAVGCSGLTSVAAASRTFAGYFQQIYELPLLFLVPVFVVGLATVNLRGVEKSVKINVVMTAIELSGLLIVIGVGAVALGHGVGDASHALEFNAGADPFSLVVSGAALAFFAIVGFEDSVNLVEETKDPQRSFPRAFFIGISITGVVYMLVAFCATALVPIETLRDSNQDLLEVVRIGAPWFPLALFSFIAMVSVSNTSLINLMMASRLLYGMAREGVLPGAFGRVHPTWRTPWLAILCTTVVALGLASWSGVRTLGGTTALLVLCVFALVNVAVLVLRRQRVAHGHYVAPTICPVLGFLSCAYLASPWAGRDPAQYEIAGVLLLVGLALFVLNGWLHGRHLRRTQVQ
jgi:APA family basic amino acid/polyamine antiporter